ncbi:MAG: TRAP transporter substrate-binding protein DctP [Gammaproteobacteria bacterium]|nr:TRAP transporter substrate-binding protein DctP [Gammaproteobacteria bacterium]
MNKGSIFGLTAAIAMAISTAQAVELKVSHVRPQGATVDVDIRALGAEVAKATGDAVTFEVYPASALGDYTVVQERISVGAIDMAVQPASASADRRMQLGVLPFLANNYAEAKEMFGPGGNVRKAMEELYAKQDIKVLAAYPVYFGGVALNVDAELPEDITAPKGIKIRVPGIKSFQLLADGLGYIGSPIPFSEAFTAVQTGVVDGVVGSGAEGYYASFRDVTKTYIPYNTHFEVWYVIANAGTFADLGADHQQAMIDAASAWENARWAAAEADQAANEQKLADYGAKILAVSDEQRKALAAKMRAEAWPEIISDIGEDYVKSVLGDM